MAITGNNIVEGTFSGTGTSDPCNGKEFTIEMDFAGTASVDVEMHAGAGWVKVETAITANAMRNIKNPTRCQVRLNCTAHTNNVVYKIVAAD